MINNERISFLFTGLAYILVGVLVITQPKFLYYWIAGIFMIQGIVSLVRAFLKKKDEENESRKAERTKIQD